MPAYSSRRGEKLLAMSVDNIGFLLDRLGQDCHPLQFLRELTQNGIEAIKRTGEPGQITWDVDWTHYDHTGVYKLSVVDAGDGMTGEEMSRFINRLSSSLSEQSFSGNYGVGAKISAATRNHLGVVYCSWKNSEGSMIQLYRDSQTGQYGLKQWERNDGTYDYFLPIEDDVKPDNIREHGTKVILLGNAPEENTLQAPETAASPSRWISKYLNTRYFRFPREITIKAREGWENPRADTDRNVLRVITGQERYLEKHSISSGKVSLTNAVAHWWILKDEPAVTNNSGFVESAGHAAALYQDELYEMATARAGMSRLQQYGVTFGYRWVVVYVEPLDSSTAKITTNTARTILLLNNEQLPWADWAAEFRDNMPEEIKKLVEEKAAGSAATDHTKSIRERLKDLLDLYKVSRYKPTSDGSVMMDDQRLIRSGLAPGISAGSDGGGQRGQQGVGSRPGHKDGELGNVYSIFEKTDGVPGKLTKSDPFPVTRWVSIKDGTREYGAIEDRAAQYLADQNLLLINKDFRVFVDMIAHFVKECGDKPGVRDLVVDAVQAWFEQALVETIMGIHAMRNSKEWSTSDIEQALSEVALTAVVMQRYHVVFAVKRQLGSRLGALKGQKETLT